MYLFIVLDLLPHSSFLHIKTSTVITSTSLFFSLFICSESWFIMAHRRSAQSAPSYMSEREAEGTHVVRFVTLFHSVSSYMLKHVQSRLRASQTGETVQDPGSRWKSLQPPGSRTDPQTAVRKHDINKTLSDLVACEVFVLLSTVWVM